MAQDGLAGVVGATWQEATGSSEMLGKDDLVESEQRQDYPSAGAWFNRIPD
jgi:hypothetical protein